MGGGVLGSDIKARIDASEDITVVNVPGDMFAGAALSLGNAAANGDFMFRMDDDDYYGPNYLLDMILNAQSIGADLFGKPPCPLAFSDEGVVRTRKNSTPNCIVTIDDLKSGRIWLGGNSISATSDVFDRVQYRADAYGAADSSLIYSLPYDGEFVIALFDSLNLAAARRVDNSSHTWLANTELMKSRLNETLRLDELFC